MRVCKKILRGVITLGLCMIPYGLFCQTMPPMPQMPQMPTVTMPTTDGFYIPEVPTMPQMPTPPGVNQPKNPNNQNNNQQNNQNNQNGQSQNNQTQNNQNNQNNQKNQNNNQQGNAQYGNQQNTQNTQNYKQNLEAAQKQALLNSLNNGITASDISGMYDLGMFGSITGLYGNNNNTNTTATTDVLLGQILESLEELKKNNVNSSGQQQVNLRDSKTDNSNFKKRDPQVLRFKVNGFNIKDSFVTVFFSDVEADGTFLLTADRVYYVNQTERSETIYLLFKTVKSNGSVTTYEVVPTVSQDYENTTSSMYKMAQAASYRAEKTGNMVSLHYSEPGFSLDVLLNLDGQ